MTNTIRVIQNNNRVATAAFLKDGRILQVYPNKRVFNTKDDFTNFWKDWVLNTLSFNETIEVPKRTEKKHIPVEPFDNTRVGWKAHYVREFTAPAGTYYIGDLCYALPDRLYHDVFGNIGGFSDALYQKGDDFFFVSGTAYGDGSYAGSDGKIFGVDAGNISIASINICKSRNIPCGHIYTFDAPVTCRFGGGRFSFFVNGNRVLYINTDDDE